MPENQVQIIHIGGGSYGWQEVEIDDDGKITILNTSKKRYDHAEIAAVAASKEYNGRTVNIT